MAAKEYYRYPSEFAAGSETDYLMIEAVRPNFGKNFRQGELKYSYHNNGIILNVPQKVVENHSQNWNNAALGEITPDAVSRILSPFREGGGITEQATEILNQVARFGETAVLDAAISGMQRQGASGITQNSILSATGGIVYNPNLEVLYEGPDFRTFNFQFVMFNKSGEDATAIYNIVEWFRQQSVPSINSRTDFGGSSSAAGTDLGFQNITPNGAGWSFNSKSRFLAQPPFVLLTYMRGSKEHPFMRPLLPAALNSVSVDYTPTGNYTVMNDFDSTGKATTVAANVTIQLTERTNLTYEDLNDLNSGALSGISTRVIRAPQG